MLLIKTYVDKSALSGLGLFAGESIPKGKLVWEYFPLIDITYTPEQWRSLKLSLHPNSFKMIRNYSYKENNLFILCTDNAQFMNHSEAFPNVANTSDLKSMFATRNINKEEELLCNYYAYSDEDDEHIKYLNGLAS